MMLLLDTRQQVVNSSTANNDRKDDPSASVAQSCFLIIASILFLLASIQHSYLSGTIILSMDHT
jgi:hypothetical protein